MRAIIIFVAYFVTLSAAAAQGFGRTVYWSPDETLQAIVIPQFRNAEHIVEIRTKTGKLLTRENHTSGDHEHGRSVLHADWSPNSQFFAYSTASSGGHSSWHCSTFVYIRARKRMFYLDDLVGGPLVDYAFYFAPPATFNSKRLNYEDGQEIAADPIPVKQNLGELEFPK
jgi:hypothetical protein